MSAWRREAVQNLPELRSRIEASSSPMALWIELHLRFADAVDRDDASLIHRLLKYARWCISDQSGPLPNDTSTAVACAFYEHLAERKEWWPMFGVWFVPAEFARLTPIFAYHLESQELEALKTLFRKLAHERPGQLGAR